MNIREAYEESLLRAGHASDPAQEEVVALLADLQERMQARQSPRSGLRRLFPRAKYRANDNYGGEPGLYIWGGVGRGKTLLMDLFFGSVAIDAKRRFHFHRMMHDLHRRLHELDDMEDPLNRVAADIAKDTQLLCLDEFFVSDIGDAMILGRLLDGLLRRGVTLVTTSNSPPDELYRGGLQRQKFEPAVELLQRFTHVVKMDGGTDYRLRLLRQAGTYLTPDDETASRKLRRLFDESASSQIAENRTLEINGRDLRARKYAKGIAWFDFTDICDGPRSQADYIEVARWYPAVIISGVPRFDSELDNQARRFIALVDEFYDRRVKLIVSAATGINEMYTGKRLKPEFERTTSRLIEMQSTDYLELPHLA